MRDLKLQSAVEYLLTYGWAFLIAAVVVAALYLFVFAPTNVIQSSCSFQSGPHCQDLILGSNSLLSKMAMLLTNTNQYTIISPKITVNITGIAPIQGTCRPYLVLPGGSLICNATISPAISQSALASGTFIVSYIPCPGGNVMICSTNQRQNFPGGFTVHASPLLSPTTVNVILTAQNYSQLALSTSQDKLTANVKLLGTPLSGATVNFTSNSVNAAISPIQQTTDGSGNAVTYIYSTQPGNVLVTASYANASSNTVIDFVQGVCFSFSFGSASSASGVITIDGTQYGGSQQACYSIGSSHSYSFASVVSGGTGIQYIYSSSSGCGTSSQSGTVILNANCTLSATYNTVYQLTISASPSAGGLVSENPTCTGSPCNTLWYVSGTSTTLGESANSGYTFSIWTGSGTGSYIGTNTAPSITFNSPITQTASFTSTTTTTTTSTTSTTTSTTSTTSTTTIPVNPTCGTFAGSLTYSGSTTLTCNVVASGSITINSGVTLNENGHYMEADNTFTNSGVLTDSYDGGAGGNGGINSTVGGGGFAGEAGTAGNSRTSNFLGKTLTGGNGGSGGGSGADSPYPGSTYGSPSIVVGGSGGNGGGIVEIYATNFVNQGTINVAGGSGSTSPYYNSWRSGQNGGGSGGGGGTIMIGYTSSITIGTTSYAKGSDGVGQCNDEGVNTGSGGCGGGIGGGGGGSGGSSYCNPVCQQDGGAPGGAGGGGACGGAGAPRETEYTANGGNGCNGIATSNGILITAIWSH